MFIFACHSSRRCGTVILALWLTLLPGGAAFAAAQNSVPPPDMPVAAPADGKAPASADTVGPPPAQMPTTDDTLPPQPAGTAGTGTADTAAGSQKVKIFDTVEFKRPLSSLPGWLSVLKRNEENPIFVPGKLFKRDVTWEQFQAAVKGKKDIELLRYVTTFWNFWPYKEDIVNWKQEDYWEIPAEFLQRSGDCEDYAIIKYFTLKQLGIPPEDMRIVVVRDTIRNLGHAILVVYLQNDAFVLDNLSNAVLSHSRFSHYSPQYSVNEFGRWAHLKGRKIN
jgi:predicted transglutaminase-like cysteine proteinase